jgi:ABC-2 type transport system ATP-binding protein
VLLSSHILAEVEAVCDRVSIIRSGHTVETGTLAELRHLTRISVTAEIVKPIPELATFPGVYDVQLSDGEVRCDVDTEHLNDVLKRLTEVGVSMLTSRPPTLEELFLRHYREASTEAEK